MTITEAIKNAGPAVPDSPEKEGAQIVLWETLNGIRLNTFTLEEQEDARTVVFTRLITREYVIRGQGDRYVIAYLRTAVKRAALDGVRQRSRPVPSTPEPSSSPEPDFAILLEILDDVVSAWGAPQFKYARATLLSQERLRQTCLELVDIAVGTRSVRDVLTPRAAGGDMRRQWGAYKRTCERTIRALLLAVPGVCVERGWVEPAFAGVRLLDLDEIAPALPSTPSPQLIAALSAVVAIGKCYQRALVGSPAMAEG